MPGLDRVALQLQRSFQSIDKIISKGFRSSSFPNLNLEATHQY